MCLFTKRNLLLILGIIFSCFPGISQVWLEKASKSPTCYTQSNADLVIGKLAYIGAATDFCMDWYAYDPEMDTYTIKAPFPDTATADRPSFTIKDKGYVLCDNNHLWQYDPAKDSWKQMSDFPGEKKIGSFFFVIDTIAFVGSGTLVSNNLFTSDFWSYNAYTNSWQQKADCIFGNAHGEGFSIKNYGYFVYGQKQSDNPVFPSNEMYRYDAELDIWQQLNNAPDHRFAPSGFVLKDKAYLGMGINYSKPGTTLPGNIFYEFDPVGEKWTQMPDIPDVCIWDEGIGFSINDKGYMGLGDAFPANINCTPGYYKKMFEYTHLSTNTKVQFKENKNLSISPNPFSNTLSININKLKASELFITVTTITGQEIYRQVIKTKIPDKIELDTQSWENSIYLINISGIDYDGNSIPNQKAKALKFFN